MHKGGRPRNTLLDQLVLAHWGRRPLQEILAAAPPGTTANALRWRADDLRARGLPVAYYRWGHSYRPWTDAERALLSELAGVVSVADIAERLGRSEWSVYRAARRFGIRVAGLASGPG